MGRLRGALAKEPAFITPRVFDYLSGDETILERDPIEHLAADGQLMAFRQ